MSRISSRTWTKADRRWLLAMAIGLFLLCGWPAGVGIVGSFRTPHHVTWVVPDGFEGAILIVIDSRGSEIEPVPSDDADRYVVRIPDDGFVVLANAQLWSELHTRVFRFESGPAIREVRLWECKELAPDQMVLLEPSVTSSSFGPTTYLAVVCEAGAAEEWNAAKNMGDLYDEAVSRWHSWVPMK